LSTRKRAEPSKIEKAEIKAKRAEQAAAQTSTMKSKVLTGLARAISGAVTERRFHSEYATKL
jgi:hypothetical protein